MGYHVIINPQDYPVQYVYVEQLEKLVEVEGIGERSIVFQGPREIAPQQVGLSIDFQKLGQDWYRAGLRAQSLFAELAKERGWVLEMLNQGCESFKTYSHNINGPIKRGDFLIRNLGNTEVEVKCRSYYGRGEDRYFLFSLDDLKKHLNMQKVTHTSVVIAVFQRQKDKPVEKTLCMIKVDRIYELAKGLKREKKEYGWVYRIPLTEMVPGFDILAEYDDPYLEESDHRVEQGYTYYTETEIIPYVLVAYYKSKEHWDWIMKNGCYNLRMGSGRGAWYVRKEESGAKYILLHTYGESRTGKLFQILGDSPRVFSKEMLIRKKYPGMPAHKFYLIYKVAPVCEKELQGRSWDISKFPGYLKGHGAAIPFAVPLSELLK